MGGLPSCVPPPSVNGSAFHHLVNSSSNAGGRMLSVLLKSDAIFIWYTDVILRRVGGDELLLLDYRLPLVWTQKCLGFQSRAAYSILLSFPSFLTR